MTEAKMYDNALDESSTDLREAAMGGRLPQPLFRDAIVSQVLAQLRSGRSVLLTGEAGAGKTAVVHAVAHALRDDPMGLHQLSTPAIISGTRYLGEWQTKATQICEQAIARWVVLYVTDVENLVHTGKTSSTPSNLLDAMGPFCDGDGLLLLGEATPHVVEQIERHPRLAKLFVGIPVPPLSDEQVRAIVESRAPEALASECRDALIALTSRFLPKRCQPGPAVKLLAQVLDYQAQKAQIGEPVPVTTELIERVLSIYSGLPRFVISSSAHRSVNEIRSWFCERLVGQRGAIENVVESIALFKAGLNDPSRPIGTFLFVGPTGVGKTELARLTAEFLFGSPKRLLRFDLSEFKDYNSFEMLVGDPTRPDRPAKLLDAIRRQPFQVVLFDELEKAHSNIRDLFLGLLDEGRLAPPQGALVDCRNTILIATSNVGAEAASRSLGFAESADGVDRGAEKIRDALEQEFRPEFLNRFQHIAVFHPLSRSQLRQVAKFELDSVLRRDGLTQRNLIVDVPDEVLDLIVSSGVDPRYGARSLKRVIQREIVVPLAMVLTDKQIEAGSILRVERRGERGLRVRALETADSRRASKGREQQANDEASKFSRATLLEQLDRSSLQIEEIASARDEAFVESEIVRLQQLKQDPAFWTDSRWVASTIGDLERYQAILDRLARLREWALELREKLLASVLTRGVLDESGHSLARLERTVENAKRELLILDRGEGRLDAIVAIHGVGGTPGRRARDLLFQTYRAWAEERKLFFDWIVEPCTDDDPVVFGLRGPYSFGYLKAEAGLHRVREGDARSVARVRVAAWRDDVDTARRVEILNARALKTSGQFGGRVRSRLECDESLVLQNAKNLSENQRFAADLVESWRRFPPDNGEIVRRYDVAPFLLRDAATGFSSGRPDCLSSPRFHELLTLRVDAGL
ncbi:MAG: AAA family ATPase [Myxococcales bacterium]|nr:AAA family ATPase [Myxococcales bacterium]